MLCTFKLLLYQQKIILSQEHSRNFYFFFLHSCLIFLLTKFLKYLKFHLQLLQFFFRRKKSFSFFSFRDFPTKLLMHQHSTKFKRLMKLANAETFAIYIRFFFFLFFFRFASRELRKSRVDIFGISSRHSLRHSTWERICRRWAKRRSFSFSSTCSSC